MYFYLVKDVCTFATFAPRVVARRRLLGRETEETGGGEGRRETRPVKVPRGPEKSWTATGT